MALETRERSVTTIVSRLNAFWTSSLMNDRHIADQAWRGYLNIADNLYTQLYQLNYSKCINSISHNWISHWERFVFDDTNKVETFNALYPHAYKLPDNVKSVYLLRESPREISILPALTLLLNTKIFFQIQVLFSLECKKSCIAPKSYICNQHLDLFTSKPFVLALFKGICKANFQPDHS